MEKFMIEKWVNSFRKDPKVRVFIHNKVGDSLVKLFLKMGMQEVDKYDDNDAHILGTTEDAVAYRTGNNIYFIPAKAKPIPFGITSDNKVLIAFDYPCEMKVEDLEEY